MASTTALNPKAAWPFPRDRKELEAENLALKKALQNCLGVLNEPAVIAIAANYGGQYAKDEASVLLSQIQ